MIWEKKVKVHFAFLQTIQCVLMVPSFDGSHKNSSSSNKQCIIQWLSISSDRQQGNGLWCSGDLRSFETFQFLSPAAKPVTTWIRYYWLYRLFPFLFFFQKHQRETIKYFLPCPAGTVKIKSTHAITIPYCNYSDIPVIIDGKTTAAEQIQTWRRFPVNIWKKKKKRYQTVEGEKYNSDRLNSEQRYCIQMSAWAPLQLTSPTLSAMSNMLHTPWFIKRLIDCSSNTKCHFANLIMGVKSHSQSQVSL